MIRALSLLLIGALSLPAAGLQPVDEASYPKLVTARKGKVLLVNFWATWCAPCRKEMPDLASLHARLSARGFELVTISADEPESAKQAEAFLSKAKVAGPYYLKRAKSDDDFINALDKKWSGALPASFLYDRQGRKVKSFYGEVKLKDLEAAIEALL